jgi:hypothetical protein
MLLIRIGRLSLEGRHTLERRHFDVIDGLKLGMWKNDVCCTVGVGCGMRWMQMWMMDQIPQSHTFLLYSSAFAIPSQHDPENSHQRKIGEQKSCATSTIPTCPGHVSRICVERHQDDAPRSPHALSGVMITRVTHY